MRVLLVIILCSFFNMLSYAQCEDFDNLLKKGDAFALASNPKYQQAIQTYTAALIACPQRAQEASDKLVKVFERVEALKKSAQHNEKVARRALAQANKLISYYGFSDNQSVNKRDRAWAYNLHLGKFALINNLGDTLTDFLYTQPQEFTANQVVVFKNSGYVLLSREGEELTIEYDVIIERENGSYFISKENGKKTSYLDKNGRFSGWYSGNILHNPSLIYSVLGLNRRYGFIDKTGKNIIPTDYNKVEYVGENRAILEKDKNQCLVDLNGKIIIPFQKQDIEYFIKGVSIIKRNGKYGFIDTLGVVKVPIKFDLIRWYFKDGLVPAKLNGKYGYIDELGNTVIPFKYDKANAFNMNRAAVMKYGTDSLGTINKKQKLWGYIDQKGKEIISCEYESVDNFSSTTNLAKVYKNKQEGIIDTLGNFIVPIGKYESIEDYLNGVAWVKSKNDSIEGEWKIINTKGEEVEIDSLIFDKTLIDRTNKKTAVWQQSNPYNLAYEKVNPISENLIVVKHNSKWGIMHKNGFVFSPMSNVSSTQFYPPYIIKDYLGDVQSNKPMLLTETKYTNGLINQYGKLILPLIYSTKSIEKFREIWRSRLKEKEALWVSMNTVAPKRQVYSHVTPFENGLAKVNDGSGYIGVIDTLGREIIPPVSNTSQNIEPILGTSFCLISQIQQRDRWFTGVMNKMNEVVIPIQYKNVVFIKPNLFILQSYKNTFSLVDCTGKVLIKEGEYEVIKPQPNALFLAKKNNYWGVIDKNNNVVVPFEFIGLDDFQYGVAIASKGINKKGLIKLNGEWMDLPYYDLSSFNNGYAIATSKSSFVVVDTNYREVFQFHVDGYLTVKQFDFSEQLIIYEDYNKKLFGFQNKLGEIIIAPQYEEVEHFYNGLAIVKNSDKKHAWNWKSVGVIDEFGKEIIKPKYSKISFKNKYWIEVRLGKQLGYFNFKGQEIIPLDTDKMLMHFYDSLAEVYTPINCSSNGDCSGNKWGYINNQGDEIIPVIFDKLQFFTEPRNIARVVKNKKYGFYSLDQQYQIPAIYEDASILPKEGLVAVKLNSKWGFVDNKNNMVIPFIYDDVTDFKKGLAYVKRFGLAYYINKENKMVLTPEPTYWLD